jgi:large subunit ribosomal protein L11
VAKKVVAQIKLQLPAGTATPGPPVGPALGAHGLSIMEFVKAFNEKTRESAGMIIPAVITVYADRSFTFITKQPPVVSLLKKFTNVPKGSGAPNVNKVGQVTWDQCIEIAKIKIPDMNTAKIESAASMVAGTARSMGIEVVGRPRK